MEINKIMQRVKAIAESREETKGFNYPITTLESNFKNLIKAEPKIIIENPIIKLSWYKNIVTLIKKNTNIMKKDHIFYKYGVIIKFNKELSIKYLPYVIAVKGKFEDKAKFVREELLGDIFKNHDRCFYCNRAINLKNEVEYKHRDSKLLCLWCYDGLEGLK